MFNLQGSEIIFILLLALVVLGPEKLPSAIRRFTQTYGELRKMGTGFQTELKSALDEPMREMRETADLLKEQADPAKIAASADTDGATGALESERAAERVFEAERDQAIADSMTAADSDGDAVDAGSDPALADGTAGATVDEWADPIEPVADDDAGGEGPVRESA